MGVSDNREIALLPLAYQVRDPHEVVLLRRPSTAKDPYPEAEPRPHLHQNVPAAPLPRPLVRGKRCSG